MMKIIKRERKVRLDELIKYVFDNDVKNKEFTIKICRKYSDGFRW